MSDLDLRKLLTERGSIYKNIKNAVKCLTCGVQITKNRFLYHCHGTMSRNFEFSFYKKDRNKILIFQKEKQQRSNK